MTLHLPTLLLACVAMMVMSAGVMTLYGLTRAVYGGFWWWTVAQWLLALGLMLHALRDAYPAVLPLANLLLLQWPVLILSGVRHFYPRHVLRAPPLADALLLAVAFVVWVAAWASGGELSSRVAAFAAGAAVLHLYSAALTAQLRDFARSAALKSIVVTQCCAGAVQLLRLVQSQLDPGTWLARDELLLAGGLVIVVLAMVMVFSSLVLTAERNESKLLQSLRQLRFLADMDTLTGVPNRRHFHELAGKALAQCAPGPAAIVMFDIDHFKRINDDKGHAAGDEALRDVARCTRDTLRECDVAGRLGGDEFALLLPGTGVQAALTVADRIALRLNTRPLVGRTAPLSLSFGVVLAHAGENIQDAVHRADQALYEAKRQGRNRAVVASGNDEQPVFTESRPLGLNTV